MALTEIRDVLGPSSISTDVRAWVIACGGKGRVLWLLEFSGVGVIGSRWRSIIGLMERGNLDWKAIDAWLRENVDES